MAEKSKPSENDIAAESYKGPSIISAMAGEGFVAHFQWALTALGVVGGLAAIFHGPAEKILTSMRGHAFKQIHADPKSIGQHIKNGWGELLLGCFGRGSEPKIAAAYEQLGKHGVKDIHHTVQQREVGLGLWIFNHTIGLFPPLKKMVSEAVSKSPRFRDAFSAAGPFAFFGYFILPIFMSGGGAEKGRAGKEQFERAKDEIVTLRTKNDQLREAHGITHAPDGTPVRVSDDNPPVVRDPQAGITVTQVSEAPAGTDAKETKHAPAKGERDWGEAISEQKATRDAQEPALA